MGFNRSIGTLSGAIFLSVFAGSLSLASTILPGDILISNHTGSNVQLLNPTTGIVSTLVSVSGTPIGLAFDGSQNLYINVGNGIQKYNPNTNTLNASFFTGVGQREGLAFDSLTQDLFSVSFGANAIEQVDLAGNLVRTINIANSSDLLGVTARDGTLIVTDYSNGNVYLGNTLNPTSFTTIGTVDPGNTYAADINAAGDIFVNDFAGSTVKFHFNGTTWVKTIFISGLNGPDNGLAIGDDGSFTISQFGANSVTVFNSDGSLRHNYTGVASPDELTVWAPVRSGGTSTPEPSSILLLSIGVLGLGALKRRRVR
jgi:PEP-CTERM motif